MTIDPKAVDAACKAFREFERAPPFPPAMEAAIEAAAPILEAKGDRITVRLTEAMLALIDKLAIAELALQRIASSEAIAQDGFGVQSPELAARRQVAQTALDVIRHIDLAEKEEPTR